MKGWGAEEAMMRITRLWRPLAMAAALIFFGVSGTLWAQTGGLQGKTTLQNGQPCAKCTIQLDRLDVKATYHVKTNKNGEYIYIGLPLGTYKVTLLDPNGTVLFYTNNVHIGIGDPTVLDFNLPKEEKQAQKANPEAAKQAEEASKAAKQFTGMKQLFDQGKQALDTKDYTTAIDDFQKALPMATPKNQPIILGELAQSYSGAKQYDQALATYQKTLELTPDDASVYNNLGSTYAEMNKPADAQKAFEKAASLDPTHAATYFYNLGVIMYNQGKMDEAGDAFKKAIGVDPKYAEAYFYEGQALLGRATTTADGKISAPPGTVDAYKKYLELAPNGPNAAVAQQMIETLGGSVDTSFKRKKGKS
jgi:tetratricopeptide (TPR) repeat protein